MNLSSLDLNLLWTLHVVLQEGSVAGAAARLHVTAPAVSNALARLREALDDPLLVRAGRGLVATPRAAELQPELEAIFGKLEHALTRGLQVDPARLVRAFTIALSDADQVSCLPTIASMFAKKLPLSTLHVVSIDTLLAEGGLGSPSTDLTISPRMEAPGLRQRHLFDEEAAFVARKGHPLLQTPVTRSAFNEARHVDVRLALGREGRGNQRATEAMTGQGFTRDVALTVPAFVPAVMVAASTDLVAGVPRRLAEALIAHHPIGILHGDLPTVAFEMMLTWHERTEADPGAIYLRALITRAASAFPVT